jgi:methionyl-tRNA formyltransferase
MAIIYFGSPALATTPLKALIEAGVEVAAVVTQPDARRGRGGKKTPSPVKAVALEHGIKSFEPISMGDEALIAELLSYKPEFLVVVAYGRLLPKTILDIPSIAPVNLHASLLPRYRGAAPINWAIINGEAETGLTTMLMSEGLDEGDILLEQRISISPDETAKGLGQRMSEAGGPLLLRTLDGLRDGSVRPVPQAGKSTYARALTKDDGQMNFELSAQALCSHIHGVYPWPGAFCYSNGKKLKINSARVAIETRMDSDTKASGVVLEADKRLIVSTGDGSIEILNLQPEGKRAMSADDFLRGHGMKIGTRLE